MKSIGISFYILPGFRGDCLCRLGRYVWKVEKEYSPQAQLVEQAELEAEMRFGYE